MRRGGAFINSESRVVSGMKGEVTHCMYAMNERRSRVQWKGWISRHYDEGILDFARETVRFGSCEFRRLQKTNKKQHNLAVFTAWTWLFIAQKLTVNLFREQIQKERFHGSPEPKSIGAGSCRPTKMHKQNENGVAWIARVAHRISKTGKSWLNTASKNL